jgi:predicted GH43/DUF377 family glycosyl hydrolase
LRLVVIYHGVNETTATEGLKCFIPFRKPEMELSRLPSLSQQKNEGVVNNVVFPTGHALFGDDLIYYGAADMHIAVAKVSLTELLDELKKTINTIVP